MPVANIGSEAMDETVGEKSTKKPMQGMKPDIGRKRGRKGRTGGTRYVDIVAEFGLTIGQVDTVAFRTGNTGGEKDMQNAHRDNTGRTLPKKCGNVGWGWGGGSESIPAYTFRRFTSARPRQFLL